MFYSCQMCMCVVNMAINKGPGANLNEQMSPCFITTKLNIFSSKYQQYYTQSLMLNNGRINLYFQEKKGRKTRMHIIFLPRNFFHSCCIILMRCFASLREKKRVLFSAQTISFQKGKMASLKIHLLTKSYFVLPRMIF